MAEQVWSVSDFVAVLNQTLEFSYPNVVITGELANFRISKNRWVYFDLKDEAASVRFFGTVYNLPGPLEDGMLLQVRGAPRLHPLYGFSINIQTIQPVGKGSIKKAAQLLEAKLAKEGLFDESRKRPLPYPPRRIGLITSSESAAYRDFMKVLNGRWGGVEIDLIDVLVQGELAAPQIVEALSYFETHYEPVDAILITRGGGSAEDLAAFSTEQVTRAVAGSRIPTLVAIGHEIDISLAELAADQRASTPSNAAELLVPDKRHVLEQLGLTRNRMLRSVEDGIKQLQVTVQDTAVALFDAGELFIQQYRDSLIIKLQLLTAFSPQAVIQRGYAIVRKDNVILRSIKSLKTKDRITVLLSDGSADSVVKKINLK